MPRYLVQGSYTPAAIATFVSNPQDRTAGVQALAAKLGGKCDSLEFALGEHDIVAIISYPDDVAAAASAMAVLAAGHVRSIKTTRLISADDFLAAQKKAHGVNYQAPKPA